MKFALHYYYYYLQEFRLFTHSFSATKSFMSIVTQVNIFEKFLNFSYLPSTNSGTLSVNMMQQIEIRDIENATKVARGNL